MYKLLQLFAFWSSEHQKFLYWNQKTEVKLSLPSSFPERGIPWCPKNFKHSITIFKHRCSLDLCFTKSLFINSATSPHFGTVTWFVNAALWHLEFSWVLKHFGTFFQLLKPVEIYAGSLLCSPKSLSSYEVQKWQKTLSFSWHCLSRFPNKVFGKMKLFGGWYNDGNGSYT